MIHEVECSNISTTNFILKEGYFCVSSLGIYRNLSAIVLSLYIPDYYVLILSSFPLRSVSSRFGQENCRYNEISYLHHRMHSWGVEQIKEDAGQSHFYMAIDVINMELNYRSVRSSSSRGRDGLKRVDGGIVTLAQCEFHFCRYH